eukprot:gnl/Hemi2/23642_TR7933_c0_g1_i1.p1 gnl/Hemi2/23642_TR7933_c0_g1~~gnl/Hemi2/23642_TR7933_c0_g1_i1.p1  ORF type:complete len:217 (+),score=41.50 gnl/Hemi2/23642_TR7933_c0_g1_i1:71-721(+)
MQRRLHTLLCVAVALMSLLLLAEVTEARLHHHRHRHQKKKHHHKACDNLSLKCGSCGSVYFTRKSVSDPWWVASPSTSHSSWWCKWCAVGSLLADAVSLGIQRTSGSCTITEIKWSPSFQAKVSALAKSPGVAQNLQNGIRKMDKTQKIQLIGNALADTAKAEFIPHLAGCKCDVSTGVFFTNTFGKLFGTTTDDDLSLSGDMNKFGADVLGVFSL